jgi:hypothetical protein
MHRPLHDIDVQAAPRVRHVLHRDYETRGTISLKAAGTYKYAAHASASVIFSLKTIKTLLQQQRSELSFCVSIPALCACNMAQRSISLVEWHVRINHVSGSMVLHYTKAAPADVLLWARQLHRLAHEMKTAALAAGADPAPVAAWGYPNRSW